MTVDSHVSGLQPDDYDFRIRERIDRRPGAVRNREWPDRQHELPAIARGGEVGESIEVAAVDQHDAQMREHEVMKGEPRQIARRLRHVARRFPRHPGRCRRFLIHGITELSRPAAASSVFHGPSLRRGSIEPHQQRITRDGTHAGALSPRPRGPPEKFSCRARYGTPFRRAMSYSTARVTHAVLNVEALNFATRLARARRCRSPDSHSTSCR